MARLSAKERASLPDSAFAYIDSSGQRRLPINDESHVRNALARFSQVKFESEAAREKARSRLLRAAHSHGIMPVGFIASQVRSERTRQEPQYSSLPSGFVTLMITDIERSTSLVQTLEDGYEALLSTVRGIISTAVTDAGGSEVEVVGDEVFSVFSDAQPGVLAAVEVQRMMTTVDWPDGLDVKVRVGVHSGHVELTKNGYIGVDINKAARVCSVGHGGQIVVSEETRSAVEGSPDIEFHSLGDHQLAGLSDSHSLFQVKAQGLRANFPPLRTQL